MKKLWTIGLFTVLASITTLGLVGATVLGACWLLALSLVPLPILFLRVLSLSRRLRQAVEVNLYIQQSLEKVSHDLIGPLSSLSIFARKNYEHAEDKNERDNWIWAVKQVEWLILVVQKALDARLLRQGRLKLDLQEIEVNDTVAEVRDLLDLLEGATRGRLIIQGSEAWVKTDPVRFKQILFNLLNNALRYTEGKVSLSWKEVDGQKIRFSVEDEGPGLPEKVRQLLMSKPNSLELSAEGEIRGFGLGLQITKDLLQLCGSRLEHMPSRKGTRWEFDLPVAPNPASKKPSKPWKILLVEDDLLYARLFEERARGWGKVTHCSDLAEVDRVLDEEQGFDVVVADLHLRKGKGTEAFHRTRERRTKSRTPRWSPSFPKLPEGLMGFMTFSKTFENGTRDEPKHEPLKVLVSSFAGNELPPSEADLTINKPLKPSEFTAMFASIARALEERGWG